MKGVLLPVLFAAVATLASASVINRLQNDGSELLDGQTWKVGSRSDDHITYVRRQPAGQELSLAKLLNIECNDTTTKQPPVTTTPTPRRTSSARPKSNLGLRSGDLGESRSTRTRPGQASSQTQSSGGQLAGGNAWWVVTHQTDDHITYTRKNSTLLNQRSQDQGREDGLQQGKLRRIGSGSDSVDVRVVSDNEEELTEEGLLAGRGRGQHRRGHSTFELVHPYVKKTNRTLKALKSLDGTGKSGKAGGSGRRHGPREGGQTEVVTTPAPVEDDHLPRVGDEQDGWRVIGKNRDQISWERVEKTIKDSPVAVASSGHGLKALDGQSGRSVGGAQRQLIPSAEGTLVEGFPRVFNTYSRALFGNESTDIDSQASIRTSLTNTSNWNVGDELAGWRVIGKDYRGIIWEKITNKTVTFDKDGDDDEVFGDYEDVEEEVLTEEELLARAAAGLKSGIDSSEGGSGLGNKVPPGTWYLAKETKNSVTWQRDGVADNIVFDGEAYPRVGDLDSLGTWRVESKTKEQITWVRLVSI